MTCNSKLPKVLTEVVSPSSKVTFSESCTNGGLANLHPKARPCFREKTTTQCLHQRVGVTRDWQRRTVTSLRLEFLASTRPWSIDRLCSVAKSSSLKHSPLVAKSAPKSQSNETYRMRLWLPSEGLFSKIIDMHLSSLLRCGTTRSWLIERRSLQLRVEIWLEWRKSTRTH